MYQPGAGLLGWSASIQRPPDALAEELPVNTPDDDDMARALQAGHQLTDAPEPWVARAQAVWRPRGTAVRAGGTGITRWLTGWLGLDTAGAGALALGARGGGSVRQLLFGAEGLDVDLRVQGADEPGQFDVRGQVMGDAPGTVVRLCGLPRGERSQGAAGDDAPVASASAEPLALEAAVDELGEFHLGTVGPGRYWLTVVHGDTAVELPAFVTPPAEDPEVDAPT